MDMKFGMPIAAAAFMVSVTWSANLWAAETACEPGEWTEIRTDFFERSGCVKTADRAVPFKALAFNLSKYKLGLRGSKADGALPTLDDVNTAEAAGKLADYSLERAMKEGDLAVTNVGYPEDGRFFVASGLVRIAGSELAERDTKASFKSAMFCLNEEEYNKVGSRIVVFNAFENYRPIQLNDRLRETNCTDVVQVGPRIVEYRAKGGIEAAESKNRGQKYTVFAQGNGGATKGTGFLGYIFTFEDEINLYDIQQFMLAAGTGTIDTKMRISIVIATGDYSGLAWLPKEGDAKQTGSVSKAHPVFLTVRAAD